MELIQNEVNTDRYEKYNRAKKQVKQIKGFYGHILVFLIINVGLLISRFLILPSLGIVSDDEGFNNWLNWNTFITPVLWFFGLAIHGFKVYNVRVFKKWEDKKIQEIMEKEK
ncbi:MAG: 2TM domain-containing protein [Bacteroidetes bacterium]|nr:2TM domain-containing protein [Bacteroidota bacterium]